MSGLLPCVQMVAGTAKGFVDAADGQESALLTGETEEELFSWKHAFEAHGLAGLRASRFTVFRRRRFRRAPVPRC